MEAIVAVAAIAALCLVLLIAFPQYIVWIALGILGAAILGLVLVLAWGGFRRVRNYSLGTMAKVAAGGIAFFVLFLAAIIVLPAAGFNAEDTFKIAFGGPFLLIFVYAFLWPAVKYAKTGSGRYTYSPFDSAKQFAKDFLSAMAYTGYSMTVRVGKDYFKRGEKATCKVIVSRHHVADPNDMFRTKLVVAGIKALQGPEVKYKGEKEISRDKAYAEDESTSVYGSRGRRVCRVLDASIELEVPYQVPGMDAQAAKRLDWYAYARIEFAEDKPPLERDARFFLTD